MTVNWRVSKAWYETASGTVKAKITDASIKNFEIKANDTVTYDGAAHKSATVVVGIPADATITYTCGSNTYNEVPSFTNADTYTVNYTISKDNYADVTGNYTFTIAKAKIQTEYKLTEKAEAGDKPVPVAEVGELPKGVELLVAVFADKAAWENGANPETVYTNEIPAFDKPGTYYVAIALTDGETNYETVVEYFIVEITEPAPETGDTFNLGLWLTVAALTAAAGIVLVLRRKEQA